MEEQGAERDDPGTDFEQRVATALERIRPALQADGGDVELLAVVGRDAHLRLTGACVG